MYRTKDPETSREAAKDLTASGRATALRVEVLSCVVANPGLTSRELSKSSDDIEYENFHKRLPELERMGKVHRSDESRACRVTNRKASIWFPGPKGDPEQMDLI